ncbi:hypothetical protein AALN73_22505 [Bacteroides stercorirosoris]|jgi:hypothetical protein|uniref:Uncharacterized protein n=2 Tax=Bacteroides stercorirosoris TaxID=871324 RepID=A0A413H7B8_9BACE|nr:hypothetical protein [Bacteroides stercorirosoris]RGX79540.1 hypothetical protein DXA68_07710 [Bacteroides stercorirosoris]
MKLTMKPWVVIWAIVLLCVMPQNGNAQNKELEKALKKEYKSKLKEYKKDGWKLDATSRSFEVVLLQHYDKLQNGNCTQLVGTSSGCMRTNVCRQAAYNNAIVTYANLASSYIKGRTASDVATADSETGELDRFYGAYERVLGTLINKGTLTESYSIYKEVNGAKEYQIIFLVDEDKALDIRKKALDAALEESKLKQEYAKQISDFINDKVTQITE